jgi:hypothetical protein
MTSRIDNFKKSCKLSPQFCIIGIVIGILIVLTFFLYTKKNTNEYLFESELSMAGDLNPANESLLVWHLARNPIDSSNIPNFPSMQKIKSA